MHLSFKLLPSLFLILLPWSVLTQDVIVQELLLSTPRTAFTSIEVDGFIYLAGGQTNGNGLSSTIDIYNIAEQRWNGTLTLPSPRAYVTPVHISPNIFFVGGFNQVGSRNGAYKYDSASKYFNGVIASQIQDPIQTSIRGSTLFAIGLHNVEFLNLEDLTIGWYSNEDINNIMQRLAGGIIVSRDNFIFIVGGFNVSTRQFVPDAWIYDIESTTLTHYHDVIEPFDFVIRGETLLFYEVTNKILAVWMQSRCILFNIETSTWLNFNLNGTTNIVSVPGFSFIFDRLGFSTVNWTNPTADPIYKALTIGEIAYSVGYKSYAAFFVNNEDELSTLNVNIFFEGAWSSFDSADLLQMFDVITKVEWPEIGVAFATSDAFYFFNGTLVNFKHTAIQRLMLGLPDADALHVVCLGTDSDTSIIFTYNTVLEVTYSDEVALRPRVSYNGYFFDFASRTVYDPNAQYFIVAFPNTMDSITRWAVQGPYFFVFTQSPGGQTNITDQVDLYNYETRTWTTKSHPGIASTSGYVQAFNMVGLLIVLTGNSRLMYNITADHWDEVLNDDQMFTYNYLSPLVLDINGTAYAANSTAVQLQIFDHGVLRKITISEDYSPLQLTLNTQSNQILISTNSATIFRWNIDDQLHDIFLLPRAEEAGLIMASSGNFLLVSMFSYEDSLDYCDLSSALWGTVPGFKNFIRPSTMTTLTVNGTEYILVAGGDDKIYNFYTDSVKLLDVSSLASITGKQPEPSSGPPLNGDSPASDNTALIVGLVVPFSVVLIAGALLAFFLVRKRQKKNRNKTSTIGLESNYGQWFIPFGQISFGDQLGQGGSGQVFKGTWKNTTVALKVSMTQANQSVIRELELMMQLRPHPNVVQLLGFSVHPETDSIILIIEFCDGGSLDVKLYDRRATITLKQKLDWICAIAKGLNHLHSNNVVHRDVAARNVLVHRNEPKLTDFGMSRIVDDQKQHGTTKSELGPIRWMSPESLKDKEYSTKSDVWSFGILAFEIIAQQEPHVGADPIEIGRFIRDEGRTPQLPDSCPKEITSIIQSCWHMDPNKRPSIEQITSQFERMAPELDAI